MDVQRVDVFGAVVDWRSSIRSASHRQARPQDRLCAASPGVGGELHPGPHSGSVLHRGDINAFLPMSPSRSVREPAHALPA